MTTTAGAFAQFLTDISPTEYHTTTLIPARQRSALENLETAFPPTSDMPFHAGYLMGSAAKKTIIRPIDDVDVMGVFSNANGAWARYQFASRDFLYRIRNAYNGLQIQQVGARGKAVRVFFESGGHVDIAPMFWAAGDDYWLPNGNNGWLLTAPLKANKWFAETNSNLEYHLAPLVRLLKRWNRSHSKRFRSYHLETMAGTTFSSLGSNYRKCLAQFFEWSQTRLSVYDPGGHSGDLSTYMTYSQRQDALAALSRAQDQAARAVAAEESGNHTEAKRLWRIVLGDDFPTA